MIDGLASCSILSFITLKKKKKKNNVAKRHALAFMIDMDALIIFITTFSVQRKIKYYAI